MVKVSVVIPVYNREKFLSDAVNSCLHQTVPIDEILIIDNNSEDSSFDIAKGFEEENVSVKAIRNDKNLGMIRNWNKGLKLATADYVAILHSDDILDPGWSRVVHQTIGEQDKDIAVFFGNAVKVVSFRNDYKPIEVLRPFKGSKLLAPKHSISQLWKNCYFNINNSGAIIYRKDIVNTLGDFNPDQGFEADLYLHLQILNRYKSYFIDKNLVYYRIHSEQGSYSRQVDMDKITSTIKVMENTIQIQRELLHEQSLISNYFAYILIYATKLLLTLKFNLAFTMYRLVDTYRLKSVLSIPVFILRKVIRVKLGRKSKPIGQHS